jgi:CheY-like chemotaxis protein
MKKVVVAEASPTIKSVADSLLRQIGFDVVCTSDGLQAWEVISAERPDLVLVGQGLSGLSGLELCRQIASDRLTGGIPVVLMIGAKDAITEEQILASGARGKLRKPFSPKDLLDVAERLAGQGPVLAPKIPVVKAQPETKYNSQVSSTQHLHDKKEPYNLGWLDLSESNPTSSISKVVSFDLGADDQSLIIDDDQYGLANPQPPPVEETVQPQPNQVEKDEDYEWFLGEFKKEMEGKAKLENQIEPNPARSSASSLSANSTPEKIKFDDIISADEPYNSVTNPKIRDASLPVSQNSSIKPKVGDSAAKIESESPGQARKLSEEEIAMLADRIALRLAAHLASKLDKNLIIEAIKAAFK